MENIKIQYKEIVKEILQLLATRVPVNRPTLKKHLIINKNETEFILLLNGWHNNKHFNNIVAHVEITDDNILIHEESIDPSMYERLMDYGVPERIIIPVYLRDYEMA
ncbi:MAG: XisI protein [Bacteroidota bacterium]|jgi:hypothetical protein